MIKEAMEMIEKQTRINQVDCIKFVERKHEINFVKIVSNVGCSSQIGMRIKSQELSLDVDHNCFNNKGIIAHELIHALGFDHEQNRPDRDEFVDIIYDNIVGGIKYKFK